MLADLQQRVEDLTPTERVERLHELEAQLRATEAEMALLVRAIGNDGTFRADGHLTIGGFLRGELRWSRQQVTARRRLAHLVDVVPVAVDHLAVGAIGVAQANLFANAAANPRCGDRLAEHADVLLDAARQLPHQHFAIAISRWETLADHDGAHRDAAADHEHRGATLGFHDGVGRLSAQCGALDYAAFSEILERYRHAEFLADWEHAKQTYGDDAADAMLPRTDAQRAWDALMRIATDAVSTPPGSRAPEAVVNIVCDITTTEAALRDAGLIPETDDSVSTPESPPDLPDVPFGLRRCETINGVPLTPAHVVQAILHGRLRRVVFDTGGIVVDQGRLRRLFNGAIREAVMLHSPTCIFPGCDRPATWCQADHLEPWSTGGTTTTSNGGPACEKHNLLRNQGYTVWRDPNGIYHTYHPDGHEIAPPPPRPTGTSPPGQPDAA